MSNDKTFSSIFSPADSSASGHLVIAGRDSALQLVTTTCQSWKDGKQDFHGVLTDARKASALQCIQRASTESHRVGGARYSTTYFPHYVVLGDTYIETDDAIIEAVRYRFENANCLVSGSRTFNLLPDEARQILEADHRRAKKIVEETNRQKFLPDLESGKGYYLFHYLDRRETTTVTVDIGNVSLHNVVHLHSSVARGSSINDQVVIVFRFNVPKTLMEATSALSQLHRLFELSLGRRQRLLQIELETTHTERDSSGTPDRPPHELHWSFCNDGIRGETEPTLRPDILVDPEGRPEEFSAVVSGWLNTASSMRESRNRFAAAFNNGAYSIDRIVGAANMFDLLPECRTPKIRKLDSDTDEAVKKCRAIFKELPDPSARESALSALGRIGAASLPDKVLHCAKIVQDVAGGRLPDIDIPSRQAVLCRNHFVHGRKAQFDYAKNFGSLVFLTDTLEFVFAMADLIQLGWSFENWCKDLHGGTKFASYVIDYHANLAKLKALLEVRAI